jgi:hypothetical protein
MLTSLKGRRENDISGDVEGHGKDEDDSKALAWQETLYLEQIIIKEPNYCWHKENLNCHVT